MKLASFTELFVVLLSDIYSLENELVAELPKMAQKASSHDLKEAIQHHLNETKNQVKRLDKVFKLLDEKPMKLEWQGDMKNLFKDADRLLKENKPSPLLDAAIIALAQRIEHFEIATYGTLKEYANVLDIDEVKDIFDEILDEENAADTILNKIAKGGVFTTGINIEATKEA